MSAVYYRIMYKTNILVSPAMLYSFQKDEENNKKCL